MVHYRLGAFRVFGLQGSGGQSKWPGQSDPGLPMEPRTPGREFWAL